MIFSGMPPIVAEMQRLRTSSALDRPEGRAHRTLPGFAVQQHRPSRDVSGVWPRMNTAKWCGS
jgi:hypothetical protein